MIYSSELEKIINKLKIKDENRLFLTIKNMYLDEMREGKKNVEYRVDTEFFRRKIFVKGKDGKPSSSMKPLKFILFQGGYEPDSPRLLIELKGWTINGKKYPESLVIKGHDVDPYDICLLLGDIVFDSQNGKLYRDLHPIKKSTVKKSSKSTVKSKKKKKSLVEKKEIRLKKIVRNSAK